jgi:hypothetical protein
MPRFHFQLVALVLLIPSGVSGQQDPARTGSRTLPTDSWTYEAISRLRSRGFLPRINPTVQPYRRIDVASDLMGLDPVEHDEPVAGWIDLLRKELASELAVLEGDDDATTRVGAQIRLGGTMADSRRRDPLVPFRTENEETANDRAWPLNVESAWMETHGAAIVVDLYGDHWYYSDHGDPDGISPKGFLALLRRSDNSYVTAAFPWGDVWLGRMRRNWGPIGQKGLMVSDNPVAYPQFGLDVGRGRVRVHFFSGELDAIEGRTRYVMANRVDYGTPNFWISLGEAKVFSTNRNSALRFLNPAELLIFDHDSEPTDVEGNLMFNGTLWARRGETTAYGELVVDDFDIVSFRQGEASEGEPLNYQIAMGVRYHGVSPKVELGFDYRRVSAWSYRSSVTDRWTYLDRSLADPWADFDRLELRADLFPQVRGLRLSPVVQLQRMGEGDYRDPLYPNPNDKGLPGTFLGVMETTRRVALQGRYQPQRLFFVEWDVGRSFVSNAGNVEGTSENRLSYLVRLGITLGAQGRLR